MQNYTTSELEQQAADVKAALADERDPEERRLLREELAETERQLKDQRERHATLLALADRPENIDRPSPSLTVRGDRDRSLRAIERHIDVLTPEAGDRLERLVRKDDPRGLGARYLDAIGCEDYESAFAKIILDPTHGHLKFSNREVEGVRRVSAVIAERGMVEGTTTAGGFAVPFALDPTVLLSSDGALNAVRSIARVQTIATDTWKGISSAGVTAAYQAEAAEVADGTPTLAQQVLPRCYHAILPNPATGSPCSGPCTCHRATANTGSWAPDRRTPQDRTRTHSGTAAVRPVPAVLPGAAARHAVSKNKARPASVGSPDSRMSRTRSSSRAAGAKSSYMKSRCRRTRRRWSASPHARRRRKPGR